MTFDKLVQSTLAPHSEAILLATSAGKFALPAQELGILADALNNENPLAFYSQKMKVSAAGSGSVLIEYNSYADNWKAKTVYGNETFEDVTVEQEFVNWNKPMKVEEAELAADIKRGGPDVLAQRLITRLREFQIASIKAGFQIFADALETASLTTAITPSSAGSAQDQGSALWLLITQAATKMLKDAQAKGVDTSGYTRDRIMIGLEPTFFDLVAAGGLIGNRAEVTFAGGRFSVGLVGGYRVMDLGQFMPAQTTTSTKDIYGIIATDDSFLHEIDVIAANIGEIGLTNDRGLYLEAQDITAAPKRTTDKGLATLITAA